MSQRKVFGATWWGKAWLKALTAIDYSNRLPRGRTYWNTGRVDELTFDAQHCTIEAFVHGNAYYPYEVKIGAEPIPPSKVKRLVDDLARDPDLIARLLDGELPPETAVRAQALGIELFPESSRSLKVSCTCPDGARICKHIAAVIYGIAEMIDADPFLVFRLRGVDLAAELKVRGTDLASATRTKPLTLADFLTRFAAGGPEPEPEPEAIDDETALERLHGLALTGIEPMLDRVVSLLDERHPLSQNRDFPKWWRAAARKSARNVERYLTEALQNALNEEVREEAHTRPNWRMLLERAGLASDAPVRGTLVFGPNGAGTGVSSRIVLDGREKPVALDRQIVADYMLAVSPFEAANLPAELDCWREIFRAAARLWIAGAALPVILSPDDPETAPGFLWVPALRAAGVERLFEDLVRLAAPFADRLFEADTVEPGPNFVRRTVLLALSHALTSVCASETAGAHPVEPAGIAEAHFLGYDLTGVKIPDAEHVAEVSARYLRAYLLADLYDWRPVLTVRTARGETGETTVNFGVMPREASRSTPVPLKEILTEEAWANDRFAVLSVLKTLERCAPELERIRTTKGSPARIPTSGLRDFLFETAPLMRLLGVSVRLPESLKRLLRPTLRAVLGGDEKSSGSPLLTKESLSDFSWEASLGSRRLTLDELKDLMAHAGEIVRVGEDFVWLDPAELERMARMLEKNAEPTYLEKMRAALTGEIDGAEVVVSDEIAARLRAMTEVESLAPPEALKATLRPYQERGYAWLMKNLHLGIGSLIADDMGLGKTLQVIAALTRLKAEGELEKEKVLAVLPTTLITNWVRELAKFSPELTVGVYHGQDRTLPAEDKLPDVTLTSYGTLRRDIDRFSARRWRLLVLDEAQAIKNPSSAQTQAVRNLGARQVIAMSGTPVENRLLEYWSVFSVVQPRLLGTVRDFRSTFVEPIESSRDPKAVEALRRLTAPFMLRRLKTDPKIISDLPEKNVVDRFTTLLPKQAALYAKTLEETLAKMQKLEEAPADGAPAPEKGEDDQDKRAARRGLVLKLIMSLKQICNSPSQYLDAHSAAPDSGKAEALLEILEECREAGRKVLVFTQFRETGERLADWIARATGERPDFLHGGVSLKGRAAMVDRFQADRSVRVMIVSLKAGGTGLNLTAASAVVHYDLWWNPAVEAQATDRAYRIGQRRDVLVYRFVTAGTFEEKINAMLASKRELADLTVSVGETWIGDLPREELESIFKLEKAD